MPTYLNEHMAENMTGKRVSFAVQPYSAGKGVLTKVTPRTVKIEKEFNPERGGQSVSYECFDLEILCDEGHEVGALIAGVPVLSTVKDLAGRTATVMGVSYGQLYRATREKEPQTIVKAICG